MKHLFLVSLMAFALADCTNPTEQDMRVARRALSFNEVLLMLRAGSRESQILREIAARHVPARLDADTEKKVIAARGSPSLIAALKDPANILTRAQRTAYNQYQSEKLSAASTRQAQIEEQSRQQQQDSEQRREQQRQTQTNVVQAQASEVAYERAQKNYETQRKSLEQNITSLQASINSYRRYGYNESQLAVSNQRLEDYKKQLRELTPPLR